MIQLDILYQDEHYVAVNKPRDLFVHPTTLSGDRDTVSRRLRGKLRRRIFPVHRLDRATSGILLMALSSEAAGKMSQLFRDRTVEKTYLAVVRGYTDLEGIVARPLRESREREYQAASTRYRRLVTVQLDIPVGPYPTARYSLVEIKPETGRRHQIRKHFNFISHPIVGDTTYGDNEHNHLFRDHFQVVRLMLMATRLAFVHPYTGEHMTVEAPLAPEVIALFRHFQWPWPHPDKAGRPS